MKGVEFPKNDVLVKRVLVGLKKLQKSRVNKKKPIKVAQLEKWAIKTKKLKFPKIRVRNMLLYLLGFFAGLRVSELVKLRWKDVRCRNGVVILSVRRVKRAQQKERWPILPGKNKIVRVAGWLRKWFKLTSHKAKDFIFSGRNSHLSVGQVRHLVKELVTESGEKCEKFSSHSLRRGGAQFGESRGGPARFEGIWGVEGKILTPQMPLGKGFERKVIGCFLFRARRGNWPGYTRHGEG